MEYIFSWATVELQLKPCCGLVDSNPLLHIWRLRVREEKRTILPTVGVKGRP